MSSRFFKILLKRYIHDQASKKERDLIDDWYDSYDNDFPKMDERQKKELRHELHFRIGRSIDPPKLSKESDLGSKAFLSLKIAASILVLLVSGLVFWFVRKGPEQEGAKGQWKEMVVDQGKLKKVLLPDSTEVWLNAGSKLGFYVPFGDSNRRDVYLLEGEAYFDVKKDATKPFIAHAGDLYTHVLGTSFNIKAYGELDEWRISVLSGRVKVGRNDRTELGTLSAGDELTYRRQAGIADIGHTAAENANAWISGKTYLKQASFAELASMFSQIYGVQLKGKDKNIEGQRYTIMLDRSIGLEHIIKVICEIHNNQYRKEGDIVTIY